MTLMTLLGWIEGCVMYYCQTRLMVCLSENVKTAGDSIDKYDRIMGGSAVALLRSIN